MSKIFLHLRSRSFKLVWQMKLNTFLGRTSLISGVHLTLVVHLGFYGLPYWQSRGLQQPPPLSETCIGEQGFQIRGFSDFNKALLTPFLTPWKRKNIDDECTRCSKNLFFRVYISKNLFRKCIIDNKSRWGIIELFWYQISPIYWC